MTVVTEDQQPEAVLVVEGTAAGFERERGRHQQNVAEAVVIIVSLTKSALEPCLLPWHTVDSHLLVLLIDEEIDRTDARLDEVIGVIRMSSAEPLPILHRNRQTSTRNWCAPLAVR